MAGNKKSLNDFLNYALSKNNTYRTSKTKSSASDYVKWANEQMDKPRYSKKMAGTLRDNAAYSKRIQARKEQDEWERYAEEQRRKDDELRAQREQEHNAMQEELRRQQEEQQEYFRQQQAKNDQYVKDQQAIHDQYQQRAAQQKAADEAYDSMWSKDYMEQQRKQHDQYVKDQQAIHDSYAQQAAARKAADDAYDAMWSKDYMEQQRKQHDQQVQDQKTLHDYYARQAAAKKAADDAYDAMWSKDDMDEQRRLDDERTEQRRMENEAARKQMEWKQYLAQLGNAGKDEKALMRAENAYLSAADSERKLAGEGTDEELPRGTAFGPNDLQTAYGLGQKQIDADRQKRAEAQGLLGYEGIKKNSTDESGKFTYTVADQKRIQAERDKARAAGYYDGSIDPSMLSDEALALFPEAMQAEADKKQKSAEQMAEDFEARTATKAWEAAYDFIDKIELRTKGASRAERVGRRKDNIENADNYFRYSFDQDVFMLQDDPQVMREALYNDLMYGRTSYAEITANMTPEEKTQLDGMLDNVLEEAFKNYGTWDPQREGQYEGLIKESWAYGGKIAEAQQEQENRQKIKSFSELAATAPTNGDYDPSIRPEPKLTYNSSADTYIYEPQGTELEKAYFSMNEYTDDDEQGYGHVVNKYVFASDEQKALFNTLYKWDKQQGTNYAGAYLEGLDNYLQAMLSEYQDTVIRMQAEDPVLGTANRILSYPENVIGGFAGLAGTGAALLGVESAKDKNSSWYLTSKMVRTTREQQNENLDKWAVDTFGDWAKGKVKFLANVVDSIGDNLFAMGTANMMTGNVASKAGMRLVQLIMSGEATSNTMLEKLDAHMDPTEAALYSIGDGVIEWITERWSLEALLKPDVKAMLGNKKQIAAFLAKTAAAEGSEEIASDLLNMCLDKVMSNIYGHEDELKKRYDELVVGGMTDTEATKAVLNEKFNEIALSGLAGAISGGVMGGSRVVSNTITQNRMGRNINQVNSYTDQNGTNQLIEKAKALGGESQSARMAAELEEKIKNGEKISDKKLGQLAQNIQMESQEQAASKEKEILQDTVEKELRDKGFKAQEAKDMAELIVRQQTEGVDSLNRKERMMLQESPTANQVIKDLNGETELSERVSKEIGEQTKVYDDAAQAATNLMRGRTAEGIDVRTVGKQLATQDEIDRAEGKRTKSPREVIVDREFGELEGMERGRMEDGKFVPAEDGAEPNRDDVWKYAVKVNGKTKYVDATDIKGTNFSTAAVIRDQAMDPYVYSGRYTNLLIDQIEKGNIQNVGRYLSDAYRIRWAAYTLKEMPQTGIAEEAAREIYRLSQMDKIDERKVQKEQANFKGAGNGTATFKNTEYGTQEFEDAIRDLDQETQDRIRFVADWAKTYGIDIQFADLNDTKNPWMHGSESSKGIVLNLESYDNKANQAKGIKHNIVATLGHEATHWLQRNNAAAYYELEEFVLNKMHAEGYDVAQRAQEIMESRRRYGQNISMSQAIDEIVANACDQVLGNPETVNELKKQHGKLYTKLKEYVNRLIDRIKSVTADLGESASIDAQRIMYKYGNELAKLWNGAMDEVLTGKIRQLDEAQAKEAAPAAASVAENFSMAEPVEQTRDLIAVHNLTERNLMDTMAEGGFTAPSIAVIRARQGHTKYGEISVLFWKDTIDPNRSVKNKVYGTDAWTPTRSNAQIEYELNYDVMHKAERYVHDELMKDVDDYYRREATRWINQRAYDNETTKTIDDWTEDAYRNYGMLAAYLTAKGVNIEQKYMEVADHPELNSDQLYMYEDFLKLLDERGRLDEFMKDFASMTGNEVLEKWAPVFGESGDIENQLFNAYNRNKEGLTKRVLLAKLKKSFDYQNEGREIKTHQEIDRQAMLDAMMEMTDKADFAAWMENLLGGAHGKKGVYNGVDPYTEMGNRRGFSATHWPATAEYIVKAMYRNHEAKGGEAGGATGLMAKASKEYRNITEIRKDKGRLQNLDEEEYKAKVQNLDNELDDFVDELAETSDFGSYSIKAILIDAAGEYARTGRPETFRRAMAKEGIKLTDKQLEYAVGLLEEAREIPTGYFEAKPERVVGFDEVAKVVLPQNTDKKLIEALEKNGVTYEFYDGTDEDRMAKMNDDSIMFSMAEAENEYDKYAKDTIEYLKKNGKRKPGRPGFVSRLIKETAERNGYKDKAYHGTMLFGFTEFDKKAGQDVIFVAYDEPLARTYTRPNGGNTREILTRKDVPQNHYVMNDQDLMDYYKAIYDNKFEKILSIERKDDNGTQSPQDEFDYVYQDKIFNKTSTSIIRRFEMWQQIENVTNANGEYNGIYELYTKPGKQLVVDAHGKNWNEIPFDTRNAELTIDENDQYYYEPEDLERFEELGLDTPSVNTRELAQWAKDHGYDSVRINNVWDDGGRNRDVAWEDRNGDIGIFFNPADVKSADDIVLDDNGKVVPLSERFNDKKTDIRWSMAEEVDDRAMFAMTDENAADIGVWMMSLTPSSVHTEGERALIQEYRGLKTAIDLTRKKLIDYRDQLKRLQKKGGMLTADERKTMTELEARIQTNEEKMTRLEQELYDVTRGEGYAAMMYRNSQIYKDHIEGKSQIQVEAAVDQLMNDVEDANKEIGARQKVLNRMSEESAVKTVRRELRNRGLKQNAAALKDSYFTTMSNAELEARLAEIVVKAANGEDAESIKTAIDSLAADIVNSPVSRTAEDAQDALRPLKGRTVTFGPSEQAELKAIGYTLAEIRSMTKGSGITFKFGENSTLQGDLEEIAKEAPAIRDELMDKSTSVEQAAVVLVDWVAGKMKDMKGNPKDFNFDTNEVRFVVLACMQQMLDADQGGMTRVALKKKIDTAAGEIGKMAAAANSLMETVQKIRQNAIKASNAAGGLRGDMAAAVDYYNLIARQAAEVERARVKRDVIEKLRSENTKKLIEQQQKYQEMMKKDRRARELQKDNESLRKVITTDAKRLKDRLVAETDQKNIPEEAKPLARMLVSMLVNHDMAGWRRVLNADKKMLADVQTRLAKMDEMNGTFDMDADLDWLVIKTPNPEDYDYSIRDSVLVDLMNIEQGLVEYRTAEGRGNVSLQDRKNALDKIQKAVSEIYDVIKARETAFIQGQKWQVIELAEQMEKDMENSRFKGERTGKIGKAVDSFWRAVGYGNLTPEYFIKNLKNRTMSMLHRGMHEAEQQSGLQALAAKKRLEQIAKDTGYATWDGQQKHQVKLENGKVIEMSTEQIMSLYATWNREKNQLRPEETAHLLHGGFVLAKGDTTKGVYGRDQTKQRPTRMSENDLNSLGGYLTDQQKAWVDKIVEYMSTDMAKIGNEASMKAYGIKKFTEKYYFPIKSWGGVLNKSSSSGVNNQNENRAMRQSFSRRVMNNARNAIEIGDFTATAMKHITGMITFNTVGPAVENLNKVLNQQLNYNDSENMDPDENYKRNMRAAFVENYGQAAYDYLTQFMKDVNGGVGRRIETSMREKLLSMFKKNAVAGSLSVAAQQPLSYIRAAMLINPKYLAAAISPQYWKGSYQEMLEHSGLAVIKDMGKFDMNFGQSMTDYITPDGMKSKMEKVNDASEKMTSLPGKMDAMTWTRMWSAVKLEQAALHPEMDVKSEEFLDMVADRFNELMRRTQVYDSVMVKSQNMRSDSYLKKVTTSFMAEPTLSLNVLADAWMNLKEKGGKANAAKALATFILSAAAQAGAKAFFGAGRSPDKKKTEEENFLNKFLQNLLSEANPLGLIPGYSQLVEVLINGELNDDAMGMIGKATDAVQKIFELATGVIGKKGLYRDLEDSIGQVVQLATDVPLKNVMRDFRAMVNWFSGGQSAWTGDQFAQRETSAAVLKMQSIETLMTKELGGIWNKAQEMLGMAGYKTDNTSYVRRIYDAQKKGNEAEAAEIREYMEKVKLSGKDPGKWIDSQLNAMLKEDDSLSTEEKMESLGENGYGSMGKYINDQYRAGEIDRKTAEEYYRKENPTATDKDVAKFLDKTDWEKDGKPLAEGQKNYTNYTPLYVAMQDNKVEDIRDAVEHMKEIGYTEKDIKKEVSSSDGVIRNQYMAADTDGRRRIRDAMEKAYKALGFTAEDADKTIRNWTKEKK